MLIIVSAENRNPLDGDLDESFEPIYKSVYLCELGESEQLKTLYKNKNRNKTKPNQTKQRQQQKMIKKTETK